MNEGLGYTGTSLSLPRALPNFVTWGGEDEAGVYAFAFGDLWRQTPGALEFLKNASVSQV